MDWRTIAFVSCLLLNVIIFIVIKFNDLKHLQDGVDKLSKKMDGIITEVSYMKGRCEANHKGDN